MALTDAGRAAYKRAEVIFQLGKGIPDEVRESASGKVARLAVGVSDGISKLAAHARLEPVSSTPNLRLICHEGEVRAAAERAGAAPSGPGAGRRGSSAQFHPAPDPRAARRFTGRVVRTPPAGRQTLLAVFAARGLGEFPVSRLGADGIGLMRGLRPLSSSDSVKEQIDAIRSRRGEHHPLVQKVMAAAQARSGT